MKTLRNALFMLGRVAKYTPAFFFWTIVEGLVWGCIHSFTSVLFIKSLFDMIGAGEPFAHVLVLVGWMAAFFILAYLFHEWYWQFIEPQARQTLHERMQADLFQKAGGLDLAAYDDPGFYTDFIWAINEADGRAVRVAEDMGKIINRVVSTAVIIGVLLTVDVWIVLAICGGVAFTVFLKLWRTKIQFQRDQEMKPVQRRADYVGRVFYLADYAKEIRLSQVGDVLSRDFDRAAEGLLDSVKRHGKKLFAVGTARSISTSMLFDVGILILLVYKMSAQHSITLGDFAASVSASWKLFWQINNLMDYLANFREHSLYTEKFRTFLSCKATVCDRPGAKTLAPPFRGLELKNVAFTYPNAEKPVIRGLSMTIRPGQKIALVGYNGAGKSTLIKLIMRLYDPTGGTIEINGEPASSFTLASYRGIFGAVFQDYQIFAASIAENVLTDVYTDADENRVLPSLAHSGFSEKLHSLPNGIATQLTKEFDPDGVNLSGGEAQKIAIARVFAKPCDIVILDEPSSALDPISEYELNQTIMSAALDKTVIFISHRLSTTRMADVIYMLENGEIIEQGSHDELMTLNGKYAAMFRMQAEKYNLKEKAEV